jgi:hypothetical protein
MGYFSSIFVKLNFICCSSNATMQLFAAEKFSLSTPLKKLDHFPAFLIFHYHCFTDLRWFYFACGILYHIGNCVGLPA